MPLNISYDASATRTNCLSPTGIEFGIVRGNFYPLGNPHIGADLLADPPVGVEKLTVSENGKQEHYQLYPDSLNALLIGCNPKSFIH